MFFWSSDPCIIAIVANHDNFAFSISCPGLLSWSSTKSKKSFWAWYQRPIVGVNSLMASNAFWSAFKSYLHNECISIIEFDRCCLWVKLKIYFLPGQQHRKCGWHVETIIRSFNYGRISVVFLCKAVNAHLIISIFKRSTHQRGHVSFRQNFHQTTITWRMAEISI